MEQAQRDATAVEQLHQRHLGQVEGPGGGEEAAILVAVGIAKHDLLRISQAVDHAARRRQCQPALHDFSGALKVGDRFEEGDHVLARHAHLRQVKAGFLQEDQDLKHVGDRLAMRDDVIRACFSAEKRLQCRCLAHD